MYFEYFTNLILLFYILEHLHVLSQEALDHADLPVLTATLGASALIKNSLYCYIQGSQHTGNGERTGSLQVYFYIKPIMSMKIW